MDKFIFLAKQAVETYIRKGEIITPPPDLPATMRKERAGVFVSLHKISHHPTVIPSLFKERASSSLHRAEIYDGYQPSLTKEELRGCVGTYQPTKVNLAQEIIHNALEAATRDPRFPPVTAGELPHLRYSIDILSPLETVVEIADLDVKRYGLIISAGNDRRGLLLPDLSGVETVEQQISICRQKAGIFPEEPITLQRFTVERHKE